MLENVGHIRAVRRAVPRPWRIGWIFGVLIETVVEHLGLPALRFESRPDPSVPAESRIAGEVARGLRNRSRAGWISGDQLVRERAVAPLHGRDIFLWGFGRRKTRALVRVVAHQNGRVVVPLRLVQLVLIVGNYPPVDDWPSQAHTAAACWKLVSGQFPQFRNRRGPCGFAVRFARALCIGQALQVLARKSRWPRRSERSAALRNGALKQPFR